ncbi:unnamed protein product [Linum tenue]|uniref:Uncharacterized protein n=1 Tax=Linum tenue TaxID=586396 RepID=A0AAV0GVT1_9ROSI|nr:unnamed protein product [Linum tenue]
MDVDPTILLKADMMTKNHDLSAAAVEVLPGGASPGKKETKDVVPSISYYSRLKEDKMMENHYLSAAAEVLSGCASASEGETNDVHPTISSVGAPTEDSSLPEITDRMLGRCESFWEIRSVSQFVSNLTISSSLCLQATVLQGLATIPVRLQTNSFFINVCLSK